MGVGVTSGAADAKSLIHVSEVSLGQIYPHLQNSIPGNR